MKKIDKNATIINVLIFITVVIVINLISLNLFFRFDFSKGKIYSLSTSSKHTMRQLEDRLVVKAYFTQDLPPQFANLRRYTRDLLEEYKSASGGKVRYEFIDPKNEDRLKEEAQRAGVPPVNVNVREKDRVEVRQAYLGLVFTYMGKTETIPVVQETRGLEYEITKAINKITSVGIEKVGFYGLTPDVQMDPRLMFFMQQQDKYQHAKEKIREHYELVAIDLNQPIDTEIKTLVFSGVLDSLSTEQLINIDQYIMRGNKIIFFQDRVKADLQTQQASRLNTNIFDLLAHYGINVKDNLVQDAKAGYVNVQQGWWQSAQVQYPFIIISNEVNPRSPIVSQLQNLQFLYVSEIDIDNVPPDVTATPLVYTSNQSGAISGPYYDISLHRYMTDRNALNRLTQPSKVIAALFEGRFTSMFGDEETFEAKIIVVPDMNFIISQSQQMIEPNINFLMNAVDYLSGNQALIALRQREVVNKPLDAGKLVKKVDEEGLSPEEAEKLRAEREKKKENVQSFLKYLNILLPAILLILFGLYRFIREIDRRRKIKKEYE